MVYDTQKIYSCCHLTIIHPWALASAKIFVVNIIDIKVGVSVHILHKYFKGVQNKTKVDYIICARSLKHLVKYRYVKHFDKNSSLWWELMLILWKGIWTDGRKIAITPMEVQPHGLTFPANDFCHHTSQEFLICPTGHFKHF